MRVTHKNNVTMHKLLQQSFPHSSLAIYMTHLPSLVLFHVLVSEYLLKLPNSNFSLSPKPQEIIFFIIAYHTDFKLCEGIYHPFSFDLILCISKGSLDWN